MSEVIAFTLNGQAVTSSRTAGCKLLDVLREDFHTTGVKCGCREGECGACAVLLDGQLANSCLVALGAVAGRSVTTIEGFAGTERFRVLQEAFAATSAVQCGFCMPGMVLAAEALLQSNPHPNEEEIRCGLSGNLCRCTGYVAIIEAVKLAAKAGDGLW